MRSTISTVVAFAAGLFASTVSAQGQVAIYWGQGAYQRELSVVCEDPSVDIVNIAFVNGFPKDRNTYPDLNFGNACGGYTFPNPDGTASKFLGSCDIITRGIKTCKANGKKVLLSLGGGYPTNYYLASPDAAQWLAEVLVGSFGPKKAGSTLPRPFGDDVAVDGFDLDIESSTAVGAQKYQYYGALVNNIKKLNSGMIISSAPQCVVPDAHLDNAIYEAPFDYVFVQFYNTAQCSAKLGWQQLGQSNTGFTFKAWADRLKERSVKNPNVKLFLGLPAGVAGAHGDYYLTPEQANDLITDVKKNSYFGGVMLWEATVSQNNTAYGQPYSQWIKYSIQGTFKQNYKPQVSSSSSSIRSSSTLQSSTRSSTPVITKTSTPVISKTSTPVISKTSTPVVSKTSSPASSKSSSVPSSSQSSSVVLSSTVKSSSTPVISSTYSGASSVASSSANPTRSSATVESSIHYSDYFSTALPSVPAVESSLSYSDYVPTALPSDYSASSTAEPSTVYPEDVSSIAVHSSSSVSVTSSASEHSSVYETSSVPEATGTASEYSSVASSSASEHSSVYETSSIPEFTSTASEYSSVASSYYETSSVPEVTSSAPDYSSIYTVSSSSADYEASSSTPADASSTPCTTSTELYPESSKTPEASTATEYSYYSESSKVPEVSSKASEYPSEYPSSYPIVSTKTPEASSASDSDIYSTATPTVTKPAESTTTVVTTTYLDTCSTGLTTKTTVITKTVCNACAKPSDKPEADYPEDWTTSVYVSKTLTVTITKPIHPATDVPAYPTAGIASEYPTAPKPSSPAAEYPVGKEEVPSYETPAKSSSAPYEATKPSAKPEVPSYPEVPMASSKGSSAAYASASAPASESSKPGYPEDATVTVSQYVSLTKVATPVAYTPVAYATPVVHQGYPGGNGSVPAGTGAVKPSATGSYPSKPSAYSPPEFTGAGSKMSMGMAGFVGVVAFFVL